MKHYLLFFALIAMALGNVSCDKAETEEPTDNPYRKLELSTRSTEIVQQGNDFAFRFLENINESSSEDFVISPLSMQFLLGMLLDGAKGQTADEICAVLGYGAGDVDGVNEFCQSLLKQLPELDKKTKLALANAIVANKSFPLLDSYKSMVTEYYEAEVSNKDFSKNKETTKMINKWCSDNTNGLIPEIIKNVDPNVLAYLMNATYFKSQWAEKFPKGSTVKVPFTSVDGSQVSVEMMRNEKHFNYQDNDVLRGVNLPYGNGAYSMMVILPAEGKTLEDVTEYLNAESWADFKRSMVRCHVDLWLPKFETKFEIELNDILSAMGMPSAFDPRKADFTAMSKAALCLSFVKQNAVIKVDEEGTEAAAVSFAGMYTAAAPGQHIVFHADKPFLYLITESSTGVVLFAGKYTGKH